jgi:hypothetical protein
MGELAAHRLLNAFFNRAVEPAASRDWPLTIVVRHSEKLELNRVEYHGRVSLAELSALADFNAAHPTLLTYDCLSLALPGSDFLSIDKGALDALFAKYRTLFAPIHFLILRRSAWICQSPAAEAHVRYWLTGRDTREAVSSDVRKFDAFADAGAWLVLSPEETVELETGEGFAEVTRFSIAPSVSPAL